MFIMNSLFINVESMNMDQINEILDDVIDINYDYDYLIRSSKDPLIIKKYFENGANVHIQNDYIFRHYNIIFTNEYDLGINPVYYSNCHKNILKIDEIIYEKNYLLITLKFAVYFLNVDIIKEIVKLKDKNLLLSWNNYLIKQMLIYFNNSKYKEIFKLIMETCPEIFELVNIKIIRKLALELIKEINHNKTDKEYFNYLEKLFHIFDKNDMINYIYYSIKKQELFVNLLLSKKEKIDSIYLLYSLISNSKFKSSFYEMNNNDLYEYEHDKNLCIITYSKIIEKTPDIYMDKVFRKIYLRCSRFINEFLIKNPSYLIYLDLTSYISLNDIDLFIHVSSKNIQKNAELFNITCDKISPYIPYNLTTD